MKATLIASTPNATKIVATAAWICTHANFPTESDLHPDKYIVFCMVGAVLGSAGFTPLEWWAWFLLLWAAIHARDWAMSA